MQKKMASNAKFGRGRGRPVSTSRSSKVAEKLQEKIREGNYYEAHQTYRALYQRYIAQGREKEALELLCKGASLLLEHSQCESGTDLALLLVKRLKEQKTPVTEDLLDKIGHLFSLYESPPTSDSSSPVALSHIVEDAAAREAFMRAALKWTSMVGGEEWKYGHPRLHKLLALTYWREKNFVKARDHFLYACQPEDYGAMLVEFATSKGYPSEAELFVSQAVLQLLVIRNRPTAKGVFSSYTRQHPAFRVEQPPFRTAPLLNFIWFLLLASEQGDQEVFQCLREFYALAINRDPYFNEYLDKIGVTFFGLPAPPTAGPGGQGPGGLLQQLLGGGGGGGDGGGGGGLLDSLLGGLSGMPFPPPPLDMGASPAPQTHTLAPVDTID